MITARSAASRVCRCLNVLVLMATAAGAGISWFGLYLVAADRAPFVWFDRVIGSPWNVIIFVALSLWFPLAGWFMVRLGRQTLAKLGG